MWKNCLIAICSIVVATQAFAETLANNEQLIFVKQNSKPKYFDDSHKGLCGEIYAQLTTRLALRSVDAATDESLYPIKRILNMLDKGEAHVFCGAGRNAERETKYIYSRLPVYSVANVVSAKNNAAFQIQTIQDIIDQNLVVGALFGTSSAKWLKSHEGVRVNDKYHSLEEALERLANHPGIDLFYYHDLGLNYLTNSLDLPIKVLPAKFRETPQWLIYSRHTSNEHVEQLEAALTKLESDGTLKTIQKKYLSD